MTLESPCAKCGKIMKLEFPPDATREIAERMAKLVACDQCNPNFWRPDTKPAASIKQKPTTQPVQGRMPYAE